MVCIFVFVLIPPLIVWYYAFEAYCEWGDNLGSAYVGATCVTFTGINWIVTAV